MNDPGWNQVELEKFRPNGDGMPGIVTAVVTGNHIGVGGEPVYDAAFPFVSPLCAYDNLKRHNLLLKVGTSLKMIGKFPSNQASRYG